MIFPRYQVARILKGKMTETRRRIPDGQEECRYRKGRSYAVQTPKGAEAARFLVTEVPERGFLHDVDDQAAARMGYATAGDYFEWWREQYGDGPLIEIPVWVIRFELDLSERPSFLAAHAGRLARGDYTHNEADALDAGDRVPAPLLTEFAEDNDRRFRSNRRGFLEQQLSDEKAALERQLDRVKHLAGRSGADVRSDMRVIERRLAAISDKILDQAA